MSHRSGRLAILFAATIVVAACASGGTPTDDGGGGTTPTDAPAATDASVATAPATQDAGGGGVPGEFGGKVCDLVTLDEMSAVTSIPAATAEEQPFVQGSGFCNYKSADGTSVAATSLVGGPTTDANVVFGAYKSDPSSESVPVNGGEAIWFGNNITAIVLKNGYTGSVTVLSAEDGDQKAASVALLQAMADRMP